ncbi:MAG TPA: C40 family peptidase [Thermomicrobiales bacterium]|nr:C40 family peptidase [Thermomicrobiales bacterium]
MRVWTPRWAKVATIVAVSSIALALPAAANLDLIGGDSARIAYTYGEGVYVRDAPNPDATIVWGLPESQGLTIEDGPVEAWDGSYWYAVSAATGDGTITGWVSADYVAADSVVVPPPFFDESAASGVPAYYENGGESLNLRNGPSLAAGIATSIPDGAAVQVLAPVIVDEEGIAWSLVSYDGVVGYSAASYLGGFSGESSSLDDGLLMVVGTGGDGLSLRDGPDVSNARLTLLSEGTVAWLLDGPVSDAAGDAWYQIEADGLVGWAHGAYLGAASSAGSLADASTNGAAIVEAALGYVGVPYVWAGTTPAGFDCSGFTWFIVSNVADGNFPRPNEDQVLYGSEVAADDLAPGDLVFFQNTYQWGLSHVGIYLGDGQFISASGEHDSVGVSSLSDPYWSTRYVTARRVG